MMPRILIVSNEEYPDSPEKIPNIERFGLPGNLFNISNLENTIASLGNYEIHTIHHTEIEKAPLYRPDRIILSGRFSDRALPVDEIKEEYSDEIRFIQRNVTTKLLGICLGLQLICLAFDPDFSLEVIDGGEFGFTEQIVTHDSALFSGLHGEFECLELHRCGITHIPDDIQVCARSARCGVQVIAHRSRPIWGTQFHPEITTDRHNAGLSILKNFLG